MSPSKTSGRYHFLIVLSAILLFVGLGLWFYNDFAGWYNQQHQLQVISNYQDATNALDDGTVSSMIAAAQDFNADLPLEGGTVDLSAAMKERYYSLLSVSPGSAMGYIEIPSISVSLPIYHGTDSAVLQTGAGHIPGSSLPVGGKGTHCAISAHTGMASEKMFDDLDQVEVGDVFYLHVLTLTLAYQVDQILVVEPDEIDALEIAPDQDYCTLVTCTPYGQNTHRLLVRGKRIDASSTTNTETHPSTYNPGTFTGFPIWPTVVIGLIFCGGITCLIIYYRHRKKKHRHKP